MFIDGRQIPDGTTIESDLCIVGAGVAGITIAREFNGAPQSVCLVESGGLKFDRATQSLYEGESLGLPYDLDETRSRFFGGSSNCWGGWCCPLDALDFEQRSWVPHSGWPLSRAELQPYYERAGRVCGLEAIGSDVDDRREMASSPGSNEILPTNDPLASKMSHRAPNRFFGRMYQAELDAGQNLRVFLNSNLFNIATDSSGNTIERFEIKTLEGNGFSIKAKHFVLAAGGIENPRLLLLANKDRAAGLGNEFDLVGRYFADHPRVTVGTYRPTKSISSLDAYDINYAYWKLGYSYHLVFSPQVIEERQLMGTRTYLQGVFAGWDSQGMESLKQIVLAIRRGEPPSGLGEDAYNILRDGVSVSAAVIGRLIRPSWLFRGYRISTLIEPAPNPDSRVTLGSDRDRLGLRRARLDWRLSSLDRATIQQTQGMIVETFARSGLGTVEVPPPGSDAEWPSGIEWSWHHMGTTRMNDDPKQGVVDRHCRVHSISNLFVAGSSVFPTVGTDMPTLTIAALALRQADYLKRRFEQREQF